MIVDEFSFQVLARISNFIGVYTLPLKTAFFYKLLLYLVYLTRNVFLITLMPASVVQPSLNFSLGSNREVPQLGP